jgi:hypothetical protein
VGGRDPDVGYEGVLSEAPATRDDQMLQPLLMSALGQKRTFGPFIAMSAIPPKADIARRDPDVRFVPKADKVRRSKDHSITSSARTSSDDGTVRPSAFAVLRLRIVSYLVGACTGRLAGFSPRKMRST